MSAYIARQLLYLCLLLQSVSYQYGEKLLLYG